MGFGLDNLKDFLNRPKPTASGKAGTTEKVGELYLSSGSYEIRAENWYSAKPYGFKFTPKGETRSIVMFLPINPSNLTINTNFATNVIPTLYGTVEEHSEVRYFDIMIEGTTGFAPKYVDPAYGKPSEVDSTRSSGRDSFSVSAGLALGGFFSKTLGTLSKALDKASDLLNGGPKPIAAFKDEQSGYVAFHNLYRFLLKYKKDAAGLTQNPIKKRTKHPLTFFNYKDNNEYDVAVVAFSLRRSSDNPMLYNYSIQLRGYNMRTIGGDKIDSGLKERVAEMGLDGIDGSSFLGDIKTKSNNVKAIIAATVGGKNILGR